MQFALIYVHSGVQSIHALCTFSNQNKLQCVLLVSIRGIAKRFDLNHSVVALAVTVMSLPWCKVNIHATLESALLQVFFQYSPVFRSIHYL